MRETEYGWQLYGLDELRRASADLEWQRRRVGTVNPRPPGMAQRPDPIFEEVVCPLVELVYASLA